VKPSRFDYVRPSSIAETIEVLRAEEDSKIIAGGQSLVPMMNFRLAAPATLVDISRLQAMDGVEANGSLRIGAVTRQSDVLADHAVRQRWPLVTAALPHVGHPATRSRGTFGGSAAHGDPAAELPAVLMALDAELVAEGPGGRRTVPADEFFLGHFTTVLDEDDVLVEVVLPDTSDRHWAFGELARRHGDYAMTGVAVSMKADGDGTVTAARVALFAAADRQARSAAAEAALVGTRVGDDAAAQEAGRAALEGMKVADDSFVSAAYRREATEALVRRVVLDATSNPRRGSDGH
jgi:carbon-monoxide dehydrogenase medium subunit